ncbi:hypothetical protein BCR42DRAFT_318327 [Absidia repens]|uniref:Alpha/Beta hydrolase protein n=1 Tax=Absidia repens TaxID=90262 RepID=A0A1X2IX23_9FUNG|nr:hypothetical protein BCR42DRAFT_318327 [Absidia repens]
MSTSRTELTVNGLEISVYGLTEYKKLNEGSPAAVMFAMHGRTNNKTQMEAVSQVLCSLNGRKGGQQLQRHLLVVTFDHLNHGSRLVDKTRNLGWTKGKNNNPTNGIDQWSMMSAAAQTVSALIDVLEYYLFGPHQQPVEVWGCLGFSMGAHASYITAANGMLFYIYVYIYIIYRFFY